MEKRGSSTHTSRSRVDPTLLIGRKIIQFFIHSRQMTLPMYLGHYLRGIYPAVAKYGHTYPNHAIAQFKENTIFKKTPSMFSVGGLGAYIGRFGDFAS
jgi:hypothetical protein